MSKLYRIVGIPLVGLLFIPLFISLAGCSNELSEQAESDDSAPFYTDRVATMHIVLSAEDWEFTQKNSMAERYVKADVWFDGELIPGVAVRPKGNSSLRSIAWSRSPRMSLKIDFNFFNSARTFYGLKKVNLNNGFSDPTLIREALSYDLFRKMGIPAPHTSFVDLSVNDTHLGLYTMAEQVDKTFLSSNFSDGAGNLYKPQMPAAYLKWTEENLPNQETASSASKNNGAEVNLGGGSLEQIKRALERNSAAGRAGASPNIAREMMPPPGGMAPPGMPWSQSGNLLEKMGLKTNENKSDHSALFRLLTVLNKEPAETFQQEIEKVLDVDQVLRYLAVSTVLVHLDNYTGQFGHNYYLYEINGKFTVIPWDLNMAFGTFNSGIDRQGIINFLIDEPTAGPVAERPLVSRLLSVPAYLETYHGYLTELINGPFSEDVMSSRIDELASMIRPYVQNDALKFYSTENFETGLTQDVRANIGPRGGMTPIGLKTFVTERTESIRKQLDGTLPSKSSDGTANKGNTRFWPLPALPGANPGNLQTDQGGNQ